MNINQELLAKKDVLLDKCLEYMKVNNINLGDLSTKSGISYQKAYRFINGKTNKPHIHLLARLDYFLNNVKVEVQLITFNSRSTKMLNSKESVLLLDISKIVISTIQNKKLYVESIGRVLSTIEAIFSHYHKDGLKYLDNTAVELLLLKILAV